MIHVLLYLLPQEGFDRPSQQELYFSPVLTVSMTQESKWSQGSHHLFCNIIGFLNKCPLELDIPYFGTAFNITL